MSYENPCAIYQNILLAYDHPQMVRELVIILMTHMDTITFWLQRLHAGNSPEVVEALWKAYYRRMIRLASKRLGKRKQGFEGEDVAMAAFERLMFEQNAYPLRYPKNQKDMWPILFRLTVKKASYVRRTKPKLKPIGSGKNKPGHEPDPSEVVIMAESVEKLLGILTKDLRNLVTLKLEGYTNAEIGIQLGRSEVAVERNLLLIRSIWYDVEGIDPSQNSIAPQS